MNAPPPPYMIFNGSQNETSNNPPPHGINILQYNPNRKPGKKFSIIKFIFLCYFFLFLFVLTLFLLAFYFYTISNPQIPSYNIETLEVKTFDLQPDFSLKTEFVVTVKADNPNHKIGFIYGDDNSVNVVYSGNDLCNGKIPGFHQGPRNTTIVKVDLVGESAFGSGLQEIFTKSRENHRIPLLIKVKVPVRVVIGEFPMREFKVFLNCSLVVDNLVPNRKIGIISSNTSYNFEF